MILWVFLISVALILVDLVPYFYVANRLPYNLFLSAPKRRMIPFIGGILYYFWWKGETAKSN